MLCATAEQLLELTVEIEAGFAIVAYLSARSVL
jgi:hypothetical protein